MAAYIQYISEPSFALEGGWPPDPFSDYGSSSFGRDTVLDFLKKA